MAKLQIYDWQQKMINESQRRCGMIYRVVPQMYGVQIYAKKNKSIASRTVDVRYFNSRFHFRSILDSIEVEIMNDNAQRMQRRVAR